MANWRRLLCGISQVRLDILLACGQSFRWREISPGVWRSVLAGRVWTLTQTDSEILYQVQEPNSKKSENDKFHSDSPASLHLPVKEEDKESEKKSLKVNQKKGHNVRIKNEKVDAVQDDLSLCYSSILRDYFQLDVDLNTLYSKWSSADKHFRQVAADFPGVRMLRQDPVENLFSFICSSNNNISRITGMVEKLCENYGEEVAEVDGAAYYSFPKVQKLAGDNIEQELRDLGFGYRAKYISKSAKYICDNKEEGWLNSLRLESYDKAKQELMNLCGVGAKVADCVCLMSLDKPGAIPVDTHVWQIATRDYMPKLSKGKSLTDSIYREIGDFFHDLWGDYAGWAHSVLFSADLKKFQDLKKTQPKAKEKKATKRHTKEEDKPVSKKRVKR